MKNHICFAVVLLLSGLNIQSQQIRIPVSINDKWGAIDQYGKWKIEPQYLAIKDFCNGIALVKTEEGWNYVNAEGTVINLNKAYRCSRDFSEGLARV